MTDDPLRQAIAEGDTRCPDGAALARLGRLTRHLAPPAADLRAGLRERLADEHPLPPRLAQQIAALTPAPVDLRARVRQALRQPTRTTQDRPWRLWLWVGLGHAAVLVLAVALSRTPPPRPATDLIEGGWPAPAAPAAPRPRDWTGLPSPQVDLVADRRQAADRDRRRLEAGMTRSAGAVACGLAWLRQQPTTEADAPTRALIALAFLGEGDAAHARPLLQGPLPEAGLARSLVALALVNLALVDRQPEDRVRANVALAGLATADAGPGGLGGATLLALELARAGGLDPSPRQMAAVRAGLGRPLPPDDADPARLGTAALARLWNGYRDNPSTAAILGRLAIPSDGVADPLGWWLPTLALRDHGGAPWNRWNADLQARLLATFQDVGPGVARVPASAVRHAPDDRVATAAAILCLQAAYHTMPLAQ